MNDIENAIIKNTRLGLSGGNIPTFYVFVEGACWGCGIGGYAIRGYDKEKEVAIYSGAALEAMMKICEVVGVENWEDLKGKYCRVKPEGLGGGIHVIGNILKDDWFDLKEFFKKAQEEEK
ncbi:MAG: hypothetical protein IJR00_08155 [Lachnospiraceae bacterium]|nr:hypothetical protein [Lachnospiraceae bacterium]